MRKLLFISLILSACSQNPPLSNYTSLAGHYWICDSVKTTNNGVSQTTIVGQGAGLDVEYSISGTYTVYFNPIVVKNYKVSNDTIYHWIPPNPFNPAQYSIIRSLQNKKLHVWEKIDTNQEVDYYHHYN